MPCGWPLPQHCLPRPSWAIKGCARPPGSCPIGYVRPGAPPLLLVYGNADDQVPAAQGREMADAYGKKGASVELVVIEEAEHKSLLKFDERRRDLLGRFLSKELLSIDPPGVAGGPRRSGPVDRRGRGSGRD